MKNYKDRYQRKHSITLCFNDEEFQQVEELAEALRKPRATAVRELILNRSLQSIIYNARRHIRTLSIYFRKNEHKRYFEEKRRIEEEKQFTQRRRKKFIY
ncbi:hypothetical protein G7M88_25850 [Escherichia coli]|nr:hypothetical protein [Escherichia coli]